jgi:hypothetical protein
MLINYEEVFPAFEDFPWFRDAADKEELHVDMPSQNHLCRPDPDIDLDVESVFHPERYPLISKQR